MIGNNDMKILVSKTSYKRETSLKCQLNITSGCHVHISRRIKMSPNDFEKHMVESSNFSLLLTH